MPGLLGSGHAWAWQEIGDSCLPRGLSTRISPKQLTGPQCSSCCLDQNVSFSVLCFVLKKNLSFSQGCLKDSLDPPFFLLTPSNFILILPG